MTLFAYLNGSDVGHKIRLNGIGLTSNADGTTGVGGIVFDDATASMTVRGYMTVVVKETACTAAPILFTGFVLNRTYSRNGAAEYRTTSARFIDTNLMDQNYVLDHRLITGTDGKRPAETHNERIDWLVASSYLNGLIDDVTLVSLSHPRPFEEADYRGQYPKDVLEDIAGPIFRTFFVYPIQPDGDRGLFFDTPTATVSTSTLTISNVLSDVTRDAFGAVIGTCFPPTIDGALQRDPSEIYSKVRYKYSKGLVIENDSDTTAEFFTDNGLGYRGLNVDNSRIGVESSARIMARSLLERDSTENDTITVTIQVPAASAGLIQAGQRIGVRFSHLPGYETQQFSRVTSRTIQQAPGTEAFYDIALELNNHGLSSVGGGGAPAPGDFPHTGNCTGTPAFVQYARTASTDLSPTQTVTFDDPTTAGNLLLLVLAENLYDGVGTWTSFPPASPAGWTLLDSSDVSISGGSEAQAQAVWYRFADGTETDATITSPGLTAQFGLYLMEYAGVNAVVGHVLHHEYNAGGSSTSPAATGTGARIAVYVEEDGSGRPDLAFAASTGTWTERQRSSGEFVATESYFYGDQLFTGSSLTATVTRPDGGFNTDWGHILLLLGCEANPPDAAQRFGPITPVETPDGVITTFTLPEGYEFHDGTLKVLVNRLDQTLAVTSYDGAARTFVLAFGPWGTDIIEVFGLGR